MLRTMARKGLAAADEMDYFEAVAGLELRFGPAGAGKDLEIAFDGDATAFHSEVEQEAGNTFAGFCFSGFAVDDDGECFGHFLPVTAATSQPTLL